MGQSIATGAPNATRTTCGGCRAEEGESAGIARQRATRRETSQSPRCNGCSGTFRKWTSLPSSWRRSMLQQLRDLYDQCQRSLSKRSLNSTGKRDGTLSVNERCHQTLLVQPGSGTTNSLTGFIFPSPVSLEDQERELYLACRVHLIPALKIGVLTRVPLLRNSIGLILQELIQERSCLLRDRLTSWPRAYSIKPSLSAGQPSPSRPKIGSLTIRRFCPAFGYGWMRIWQDGTQLQKLLRNLGGW